jgi:polysaccharide export outer membrane protein
MTAVSRCVRWLKGLTVLGCLCLVFSANARAQDSTQSDGFHVGDRIALTVEGPQTISDTVAVREGLMLRLTGLGDVSLVGVKRANIQAYLTQQIGKYIRDPIVHATALVRISVLGQVTRPGFYSVPSDILLSDVIMRAGGPTNGADLNRSQVKRDGEDFLSSDSTKAAFAAGLTLDQLHIAPGDELVIAEKPNSGLDTFLKILGIAVPVTTLLFYLQHR